MGFIMPCWLKPCRKSTVKRATLCNGYDWLIGLVLALFLVASPAFASADISFREFSMHQDSGSGQILANVALDYQLTPYLRNGLLNGMTLQHEIRFSLEWHNAWWWNDNKPLASVKTELSYHSLSRHYQLVRLDTNEHWNFPTLPSALNKMGTLTDYALPPLPANAFNNDASIFVTASLRPESLELPLKVQALFSDRYSLESEGVMWPIP